MDRRLGVCAVILAGVLSSGGVCVALDTATRVVMLWERAELQVAAEKLDAALQTATTAVQIAPEDADAWWLMGWVRERRDEWEQAEAAYRRGLELDPEEPALYNNLGWSLVMLGRDQESLPLLRKAIELDQEYSQAWVNLAIVLEHTGQVEEAMDCCSTVLELGGDPAQVAAAHNLLGYLWAGRGEWVRARLEVRLALAIYPGDPGYRDSLGAIAALSGDAANAEAVLRLALAGPEPAASTRAALAFCLAKQARAEEARAELAAIADRLVLTGPLMNMDALYFAARTYSELGETARAAELSKAFLARWPKAAWAKDMAPLAE